MPIIGQDGGTPAKPRKPEHRPSGRSPKQGPQVIPERRPDHTSPKQVRVGTEKITDPAAVLAAAQQWKVTLLPRIQSVTGLPDPGFTDIRWGDPAQMDGKATAWAKGNGYIELNPTYVIGMTHDQIGELISHEMTHEFFNGSALQGDIPEDSRQLFTEGLADYVKDSIFQRGGSEETSSRFDNPQEGYQGGAAFFQYLEKEHPGSVKAIAAALHNGDDTPLVSTLGTPLRDLLTAYEHDSKTHMPKAPWREIWKESRKPGVSWQQVYNQWFNPAYNEAAAAATPQPARLGPHYAEGANPGLSDVMAGPQQQPGIITQTLPRGILGLEGPPKPPVIGNPTGTTGSTGSTGSTSSSSPSSSSSSSSPPVDPREAQLEQLFRSAYIALWGEPPTEAYVKAAAHQGMNTTEFVQRERMKDAFSKTKTYRDEEGSLISLLRQTGGI